MSQKDFAGTIVASRDNAIIVFVCGYLLQIPSLYSIEYFPGKILLYTKNALKDDSLRQRLRQELQANRKMTVFARVRCASNKDFAKKYLSEKFLRQIPTWLEPATMSWCMT